MGVSIARVQDTIDCFRTGLNEEQEYVERRADEEGRKTLNDLWLWMVDRVVEAQQAHFEGPKMKSKQYASC